MGENKEELKRKMELRKGRKYYMVTPADQFKVIPAPKNKD